MSLTFAVATKTLSFQDGLAALTNEVIWLIVVATFFARAFVKTGFGDRLGLSFVRAFGEKHAQARSIHWFPCDPVGVVNAFRLRF